MKVYFYKGRSIISKIIIFVTNSPYSHVGIMLNDYTIVDTDVKNRVKVRFLDYKISDYDIIEVDKNIDMNYIKNSIDKEYDYLELLSYFFKIKTNHNKLTCVEFACGVLGIEKHLVSPGELYEFLKDNKDNI